MESLQIMPADLGKNYDKKKSVLGEYSQAILIALILAMIIRSFIVQAFLIPSGSMKKTLLVGDRILVNKFIYGITIPFTHIRFLQFEKPERGSVVVFAYPKDPSQDFIKRVIGVPGDKIRIVNKQVFVNGKPYNNPHAQHTDSNILPASVSPRDNMSEVTVPADSYFVMGDNRDNSYDSRFWGFVKGENIVGLAIIKYWSWDAKHWRVRWSQLAELIR